MITTWHRGDLLTLALAVSLVIPTVPTNAQPARKWFDIPRAPANIAVAEFARQAGVNVLAAGDQLAPYSLPALKGQFTADEALSRLLAGSGLEARVHARGSIIIEAAAPSKKLPAASLAETPPVAPQVVTVRGFRSSVNTALERKRDANVILDAIVSEDVAKFPDSNLAESMQRIPGVALIRGDGGEGRQITVRGLGPGFTRVRINGIEAMAASGASDINNSTNRSRSVDFSVFASELFNSLQVYKTYQSDLDEGSLGPMVDLRTPRPFDFRRQTYSLGAQALANSVSRKTEPRVSALYSDRWTTAHGEFGVLVSGARARRRATEEGYEAVDLLPASADGGFCSPLGAPVPTPSDDATRGIDATHCGIGVPRHATGQAYALVMGRKDDYGGTAARPQPGSGAFHPRLPRYRRSQTDYVRTGLTAALQWHPRKGTEFALDTMVARFANVRSDRYIAALSFGRTLGAANGKPQMSILDAHFDPNGSWDYGKFDAVDVRSEALLDVYTTTFRQQVFSASHRVGDRFTLHAVHGVSRSDLHAPTRLTVQFDAPNVDAYAFDFRANRNVPVLEFGIDVSDPAVFSFGPRDPDGTVHGQFSDRYLDTRNRLSTSRLEGIWRIDDALGLTLGASNRRNTWRNVEIASGGLGLALPAGMTVADIAGRVHGFGRGLGGNAVPSSWVTANLDKFQSVFDVNCRCGAVPGSQYQYPGQLNRTVDESIAAMYGKLDFRYSLSGVVLRGNAGLRTVRTRVRSHALNNADGVMVPATGGKRYADTLPALNLTAQLRDNLNLRIAAGNTMARPEYVDLSPVATVISATQSVSVGNPRLDPIRARTHDLQAEWYYAQNALVSVGYFHQRTKSFIQGVSEHVSWASLGLPNALLARSGCSISGALPACQTLPDSTVVVNRKVNTPGGSLDGLELNLQAPLSFLPSPWNNLGVLANATRVRSRITYITRVDRPDTPANEQLQQVADFIGLSPRTHNLTLYYEDRKFGARLSLAHRSRYLLDMLGNVTGYDKTFADGSTHVDMSLSYRLTPRLRLRIEGQNLGDEPLRYGRDSLRNDTLLYVHSGRSIALGLSYSR